MRTYHLFALSWIGLAGFSGGAMGCSSDTPPARDQAAGQGGDFAGTTGGSGGSSGSTTGASGTSTGAGGSVGTAGSTGGLDTPEAVCRAAVTAQCQRRFECGQTVAIDCFGYPNLCPDYYFSPGSNRTLESVRDCVSAIQAMSCSDVAVSALPSCLNGGARAAGMACAFGSQCASTYCDGGSRACGKCADGGQIGKPCILSTYCEAGAFCNPASGMCESITTIVHGKEGDMCNEHASPVLGCGADLVCVPGPNSAAGTCKRLISEGQPCTGLGGLACAPGLLCVRNADGGGGGTCRSIATCPSATCDASSYCNYTMTPAACAPRAAETKACNMTNDTGVVPCVAGTVCTPITSGSRGVCLKPGSAREVVCSDATTCPLPLQCQSGHCAPLDAASCN